MFIFFKNKILRGNHAPFVSEEIRKAIYIRSRFRNICKQQQRYKCVSMQIKSVKYYLSNITSNGKITNKKFWKAIKPFLTNKSCLENSDIVERDDEKMVPDAENLMQLFKRPLH